MTNKYSEKKVLLVGAGQMGVDYCTVLKGLETPFEVVGRGNKSAAVFYEKTGIPVIEGGLDKYLSEKNRISIPGYAIVAVSVEELAHATMQLLKKGVKKILVEKPAGVSVFEIDEIVREAERKKATVIVAYNRRFYASVLKAKEIIDTDGGVSSFNFEFTEWSHIIKDLPKKPEVKENWFLANSTHVVDLAFYLGGKPREIRCYTSGSLPWHPTASVFAGAGISECGAIFSYCANWEAPGRWAVEVLTRSHRLIFKPLEELQIQKMGSVTIEHVELDNTLDVQYKPGLFLQTKAFLNDCTDNMLPLKEHLASIINYYELMCGR